jgi:hypothetical protein
MMVYSYTDGRIWPASVEVQTGMREDGKKVVRRVGTADGSKFSRWIGRHKWNT